ncbi:MAG: hypothetical protein GEV07_22075 [Streptosporangiales bacterium]|nr:hypothetical protein [Streptosporangiales bacterium]
MSTVDLPDGHLACRVCGVPARPGEVEQIHLPATRPDGFPLAAPQRDQVLALTRCPTCEDRQQAALRLAAAHPALVGRLGPDRAGQACEGVLTALALALPSRPAPSEHISDAELGCLVRHLANAGLAAAWAAAPHGRRGLASLVPFGHLLDADRATLREAAAAALKERMATGQPPVEVPPPAARSERNAQPADGACLLCGVESVQMPAATVARLGGRQAAAADAWQSLTASTHALGGRRSPTKLTGHLCPQCADARESVGSVGPSWRERAYLGHLRRTGQDDEARLASVAPGALPAWAVSGAAPSREPWAHLRR